MKKVLELEHEKAKDFFLNQESYFSVELPDYFTFQELLNTLDSELKGRKLKQIKSDKKVRDLENVNYKILHNKDGKYAWRPFQIIHPVIYVNLIHSITQEEHWKTITDRFKAFSQDPNIECHSIPTIKTEEKTAKENQIYEWWHKVEQRSITLALEYNHVLHLDISDCYGSLYTHSIVWALHTKKVGKKPENRGKDDFIGNVIDKRIQDMSNGQTNGIPQGSVLMDFIAEMVLGYADLLLTKKLKEKGITEYKIIRYRDDYRIFTNSSQQSSIIAKELSEVLSELNFKVNSQKTIDNNDLVLGALKPDKIHWIYNKRKTENIQKWLLQLYVLGEKFPNSGTLYKEVKHFLEWLQKREEPKEKDGEQIEIKEINNPEVLISIIINLAYHNPRLYPLVTGSISFLIIQIKNEQDQRDIIFKIKSKFEQLPNTEYLDIWLQRLTQKINVDIAYSSKLCKKVNDNSQTVWNSEWLNNKFKKLVDEAVLVDSNKVEKTQVKFSVAEIFKLGEYDKLLS
ncbi:RNA-directed DNA polymerase [uncultured Tenacibaculum sp.]|uniref:RNA-directed DNA polymerase n=1 Tax=uncultured Tenacibaculum sp. TaxID=174713 RepID=UPI0026092901|nr:RNA-directed DNA polymerase [uncultured Tenacibaculum sp.]